MIYKIVEKQIELINSIRKETSKYINNEMIGIQRNELCKLDNVPKYLVSCEKDNIYSFNEIDIFTGAKDKDNKVIVNLNNFTCSCGIPQDHNIICMHMIGVFINKNIDFNQYLRPYAIFPSAFDYTNYQFINPSVMGMRRGDDETVAFTKREGKKNRIFSVFKDERKLLKWIEKIGKHK